MRRREISGASITVRRVTGSFWWDLISAVSAVLVTWLALVVVLLVARPRGGLLREAVRLLPDVLRLVRALAADPVLPSGSSVSPTTRSSSSRCAAG
jgi:hypothetical protein